MFVGPKYFSQLCFFIFFLVISSFYICCYVLFVKRKKRVFISYSRYHKKKPKPVERIIYVCVCIFLFILLSNDSLLSPRFFMIDIPIQLSLPTYIHTHTKGSFFVLSLSSRKILCFHCSISVFIQKKKK